MDDLISRQAAIDVADAVWSVTGDKNVAKVWDQIKDLPSAQPECEDAVSRFEVLRLIDYSSNDINDSVDNWYFQGKVKELPPVTPKQTGWIPCSTEMPPTGKDVLVTLEGGTVTDGERWEPQEGKWFLFGGGVNGLDEDVLAWMPLPAPYRPEGDDKHEE